jgi:hypothetical protein
MFEVIAPAKKIPAFLPCDSAQSPLRLVIQVLVHLLLILCAISSEDKKSTIFEIRQKLTYKI